MPGKVSAIRRLLYHVLVERDNMMDAAEWDSTAVMLAERIPRARPPEWRTDAEARDYIRAIRRVNRDGGRWPIGKTERLYLTLVADGNPFETLRRETVAQIGRLPAAPAILPLLNRLDAARMAFLESERRHAEGGESDGRAFMALNAAWNAVASDVLPMLETTACVNSRPRHSLEIRIAERTVTLDQTTYDISSEQAVRWLKVLADRPGEWIAGGELRIYDPELDGTRTNELRRFLPPEVQKLVESETGKGSRLRP